MDFKEMGKKIKKLRVEKGYTQEELAERLDLSVQHISAIERGVKVPKLETFIKIVNELDTNADYLLMDHLSMSTQLIASELYTMLELISEKEKRRILDVVRILVLSAD
ncbi:MAG: helix-turn-helix transcriptional regulator [Eubacteriales bacterium]